MRVRSVLGSGVLLMAVVAASVAPASANSAPLRLEFDKSIADAGTGTWLGTVSGDVTGELRTQLLALDTTGPIWHVTFDWIVDGDAAFTARLSGTLHTGTGRVVMNGTIISGDYLGAQVHEEGQLIDPAVLRFMGAIRIFPATS